MSVTKEITIRIDLYTALIDALTAARLLCDDPHSYPALRRVRGTVQHLAKRDLWNDEGES